MECLRLIISITWIAVDEIRRNPSEAVEDLRRIRIMGTLNNCFFPYSNRIKAVISLVFAHKGGFKNIFFQTALITGIVSNHFRVVFRNVQRRLSVHLSH